MLLIADRNLSNAETLANIFYYMGILAYPVCYENIQREMSQKYHTYLLLDAEPSWGMRELIGNIRDASPRSSVFGACFCSKEPERANDPPAIFDALFRVRPLAAPLLADMTEYQRLHGKPVIGNYGIDGLNAEHFQSFIRIDGDEIALTKTELMIIRYLCCTYPESADARDILKYAFRQTSIPELANIRTHISIINRKLSSYRNAPLIRSEPRIGYRLLLHGNDAASHAHELATII